jgi:phospholipid/cholesterol/gamma-HCH transport system substrate-binding protein
MKHENINYLVVGSFVLAVLVAFIIVLGLITGRNGDTENYHVYYNSVAGLKYGTIVSYEGYQLGQIENVEPVHTNGETRYKVTFSIQSGWKIPDDSIATITSSGLLGGVSIDIKEGVSKNMLPSGGTLTGEEGANLFAAVGSAAGDIKVLIKDVRTFVQTLNTEADLFNDVHTLMTRLNNSAAGLEKILNNNNQENIEKTINNIAMASGKLDGTISELKQVVASSNSLVSENKDEIQRSIQHLSASLEVIAQHIDTIAYNLEGTSRNMNEFSRQIRENPGLLLGSTPPKDKTGNTAK